MEAERWEDPVDADLVINGGTVVDGSGNPGWHADVVVSGDRIVQVGRSDGVRARKVIDARGLVVSPGFIDMHSHSDLQLLSDPLHLAKVGQGITLEVLGQDGLSYAPVNDDTLAQMRKQLRGWNGDPDGLEWDWRTVGQYLERIDRGAAANAAYLVPHGTLRLMVVGDENRLARAHEQDAMRDVLARCMEEGAVGLSSGLAYSPGMFAPDSELVDLCRIVARYGGFYSSHHRDYGKNALDSYAACIEIGRRSGVPVHLTHAHLSYNSNQGRADELLEMVDAANAEGLEVTLDSYPYLAGASYLHSLLPGWVQEGGAECILARVADLGLREGIRRDIEGSPESEGGMRVENWNHVVISGVGNSKNAGLVGRSVQELASVEQCRPIDLLCRVLIDDDLETSFVHHVGNEENVRSIMRHPAHMGSTDGILVGQRPHPRGWGSFPRYLGNYVRELGTLRLEDAIRKFTSLPAQRLGFLDRGLVRPGMVADLVVFDPARIVDCSTYENPRVQPVGIPHVMVNGVPVIQDGERTSAQPGRALRRTAA